MPQPQPPVERRSTTDKITVEELLRFKRAERPSAEFWAAFNAQLKERQLAAAIKEQRSWWHALPHYVIALPAGAAAALAIGFIVWRNALPHVPAPQSATVAHTETSTGGAISATAQSDIPGIIASGINAPTNTPAILVASVEKNTAAEIVASQPVVSDEPAQANRAAFVTHSTAAMAARSFARISPAATGSAPTLLGAKFTTPKATTSTTLFATPVTIFNDTAAVATASGEDAQPAANATKIPEASDPRRERLMAYYTDALPAASAANTTASDNPRVTRLRDRMTSRFNDKTLTDSFSRVDATGDSLTIKF